MDADAGRFRIPLQRKGAFIIEDSPPRRLVRRGITDLDADAADADATTAIAPLPPSSPYSIGSTEMESDADCDDVDAVSFVQKEFEPCHNFRKPKKSCFRKSHQFPRVISWTLRSSIVHYPCILKKKLKLLQAQKERMRQWYEQKRVRLVEVLPVPD